MIGRILLFPILLIMLPVSLAIFGIVMAFRSIRHPEEFGEIFE